MTTRLLTSTYANGFDSHGMLTGLEPLKGLRASRLRIACSVALALGISMSSVAYAHAPTKALIQMNAKAFAKTQLPIKEYKCLNKLYTYESNWRVNAYNPSGAYGIPQLKNKLIKYMDGISQVRYGLKYIDHRYNGSPCTALQHFKSKGWH